MKLTFRCSISAEVSTGIIVFSFLYAVSTILWMNLTSWGAHLFLCCGLDVLPYFNSNLIYLVLIGQSIYLQERPHLHCQVKMDGFDVVVSSSPQT